VASAVGARGALESAVQRCVAGDHRADTRPSRAAAVHDEVCEIAFRERRQSDLMLAWDGDLVVSITSRRNE
jgi:hypothetical protein